MREPITSPLLLDSKQPEYLAIAQMLMQEIESGARPVGSLLPTEGELCEQWKLSRYAARQAISRLSSLGLVASKPGVGTRVIAQHPGTSYRQTMHTLADLSQYAQDTHFEVADKKQVVPDGALQKLLRAGSDDKWLCISGLRTSSATQLPISLVEIYVCRPYSKLSGVSGILKVPVFELIEKQYDLRITRVEQEIQGVIIRADVARELQVEDGSAGLRIIRTYFVGTQVVEVTIGTHPAERYSYTMQLDLDRQPR
jgi:DNA-binding GntR family transcriptional regulator